MVFLDSRPLPQYGFRKGEPAGARFSEPPKKELAVNHNLARPKWKI